MYASRDIGLLVVLVARNKAVNLRLTLEITGFEKMHSCSHHVLRMPIHHRIFQIESLQIRYGRGFHFFRKPKVATELTDFPNIQFDQK